MTAPGCVERALFREFAAISAPFACPGQVDTAARTHLETSLQFWKFLLILKLDLLYM